MRDQINKIINPGTKIETVPTPALVVRVDSGAQVNDYSLAILRRYTYENGSSRYYYWPKHELTVKGLPDARKHGSRFGIYPDKYSENRLTGFVAASTPEKEVFANAKRQEIADLEAKLQKAHEDLKAMYYYSDPLTPQ